MKACSLWFDRGDQTARFLAVRSIDANIVLRLLLHDHLEQERRARDILSQPALLLSTVILKIVWVFTGKAWSREEIAAAFHKLLDLETLYLPSKDALIW